MTAAFSWRFNATVFLQKEALIALFKTGDRNQALNIHSLLLLGTAI
jgi:hypothetical protein